MNTRRKNKLRHGCVQCTSMIPSGPYHYTCISRHPIDCTDDSMCNDILTDMMEYFIGDYTYLFKHIDSVIREEAKSNESD